MIALLISSPEKAEQVRGRERQEAGTGHVAHTCVPDLGAPSLVIAKRCAHISKVTLHIGDSALNEFGLVLPMPMRKRSKPENLRKFHESTAGICTQMNKYMYMYNRNNHLFD